MNGFCRGCLIKYDQQELLIKYTTINRRLFIYATGIQVKRNDTVTFQLCKDCYISMKAACKFKKQCRNSDKLLKNYLATKDDKSNIDFRDYLKANDSSLNIRLPYKQNNLSTPCRKDDDIVSTTTSIRNFMNDFLKEDEIPATEAKIIQEVIEEEADILDESLDSYWLRDDISIDTNRMDFSISGLSTPKSLDNLSFSPIKEETEHKRHVYCPTVLPDEIQTEDPLEIEDNNTFVAPEISEVKSIAGDPFYFGIRDVPDFPNIQKDEEILPNFIEDRSNIIAELIEEKYPVETETQAPKKICTIDKNLHIALKDADTKEVPLKKILASPSSFYNHKYTPSVASKDFRYANTDIIKSLLADDNAQNVEQFNENSLDFLSGFLENKNENEEAINGLLYDEVNLYCIMCKKKYNTLQYLRIHFTKIHKMDIGKKNKIDANKHDRMCQECGKIFKDIRYYQAHLKRHKEAQAKANTYTCKICLLSCTRLSTLKIHMRTHNTEKFIKLSNKAHVCLICGKKFTAPNNLSIHMKRHKNTLSCFCDHCGKGFVRKSDLEVHVRSHAKIKEFACYACDRKFSRRDNLNRHMKLHIGEKRYQCDYCQKKFSEKYYLRVHIKICTLSQLRKRRKIKVLQDILYRPGSNVQKDDLIQSSKPSRKAKKRCTV